MAGELPFFYDFGWVENQQSIPENTAPGAPIDLLLTKTPDAQLSSPPPFVGLSNTPWINGGDLTTATGTNRILDVASPPTTVAAPASGAATSSAPIGVALGGGGVFDTIESWMTGYSAADLQAESAVLDDHLKQLNDEARATGTIDEATYNTTVAHLAQQIAATHSIPDQINEAWVEGALDGYRSDLAILESIPKYTGRVAGDVLHAITSGVGSGLGSILGSLPWWLWLGGAVALFVYLGGGKAVEYQARKRISRYARG